MSTSVNIFRSSGSSSSSGGGGGGQIIVGDFLEEKTIGDKKEINTVHSDRITPFADYLLINSNGTVWCPVDVKDGEKM